MKAGDVLLLPGWQNSGPQHWQSLWEARHGYRRVEQHDWMRPLRGDWSARLEDAVLASEAPVVLVAHSLGCILAAAWASVSRSTARVRGALLVAPGDVERPDLREQLRGWAPIARQPLPFPSVLVASRNDPYCRLERARELAQAWGSRFVDHGEAGHLNADSGLGDWPRGQALLDELMNLRER
ncbi:alpha/beta hydrolase [Ramlibacter tataouinensis]|uniref:RBBP9/YdeN family alpha/beta hydrolase n=1 Tax=Ramlibacter tataouinensis TaxID=94132 RepID=UPI0022F406E1|nr:alpha/beta hydrolase [Ramlibacter tataouinensis]WBY00014.1 alpha/beta hydrolase [Ramlibacter tataouinensis]